MRTHNQYTGIVGVPIDPETGEQLELEEREHTPPALAEWLVELARRCKPFNQTEVTGRASAACEGPR